MGSDSIDFVFVYDFSIESDPIEFFGLRDSEIRENSNAQCEVQWGHEVRLL